MNKTKLARKKVPGLRGDGQVGLEVNGSVSRREMKSKEAT